MEEQDFNYSLLRLVSKFEFFEQQNNLINLTIFIRKNYLKLSIDSTDHTNSFVRRVFLDHFVAGLCSLVDAVAHEHRVCNFDEDVVDAVDVQVLDGVLLHVLQHLLVLQSPVKTTVAVWSSGDFAASFENYFSLEVETGNHSLFEKDDLEMEINITWKQSSKCSL